MKSKLPLATAICFCLILFSGSLYSDDLRVLPEGQLPNDSRLKEPVTLHDYHPFRPVGSKPEWEIRQKHIKLRMLLGSGLWPHPTKTPLNQVIHGKIDKGDYTVERVFFESMPGHFVTGSLYRPAGESLQHAEKDGKRPAVLCPHGHWKNGRFYDAGEPAARNAIAIGAERFMEAAHSPLQARCVQLARMGCVVFHYDMLGNADSIQFQEHRRGPRDHMMGKGTGEWGFVSPQATARLQTNFGLQTWNSIRALDFILGLDGIDEDRVLVTGASGGATQTMMVAALDDRVDASFPCVMVSTAMQGGCTCENTYFLRIGQGNIDIAAAVAPRPQGLTAADDWTVELETKGHPDLLKLYELAGAKGKYEGHFDIQFKHNYNHVSRTHMYDFVNRHFRLGFKEPVLEADFKRLSTEEMTVWSGKHKAPSGDQVGDAHEKALNRWWAEDSDKTILPILDPTVRESRIEPGFVLTMATEILIGREMPVAADVNFGLIGKEERNGYLEMTGLIGNEKHGEEIPAAFAFPGKDTWKGKVALWISPDGKAGIFENGQAGTLIPAVRELIDRGVAVVGLDLFKQGEFLNPGDTNTGNPEITYSKGKDLPADSWQRSPVYYYGYNDSTFSRRVHDILTAVAFVRNHETWKTEEVSVIGLKGAGHWVAAARAVGQGEIDKAVVDTSGFRFENLESAWDADFLPGAVKYGDIAGFLVQSATFGLLLGDRDAKLREQVATAFKASGAEDWAAKAELTTEAIIEFVSQ